MKLLCERLRECRENAGLSKQKAAKLIGVSQPAYLRYESGERSPSLQVIKEIAKVFHTSSDYLIGKTNDSHPTLVEIDTHQEKNLAKIIELSSNMSNEQLGRLLSYAMEISNIDE